MNTKTLLLYGLCAVLLLGLSWTPGMPFFLVFFGFVPLLMIDDAMQGRRAWWQVALSCLIVLFVVAFIAVWWLLYASFAGVLVMLLYALGFTSAFVLFHVCRKITGNFFGYLSLVAFWISWEYANYLAEIPLPWLNLGNVFAKVPHLVQWYEYTGVLGGSVWILVLNILLFLAIKNRQVPSITVVYGALFALFLSVPMLISIHMYKGYTEQYRPLECLIVQPNIDPYKEKYTGLMSPHEQLKKGLDLAESRMDSSVRYVVLPETAITGDNWLHEMDINPRITLLHDFVARYPWVHCIAGADLYAVYPAKGFVPPTANRLNDNYFFDAYNAALQVDSSEKIAYYFKSKLLVGVEMLPYPEYFPFIQRISAKFGGAAFTLATQQEPSVFYSTDATIRVAPIICYESVFGDYVAAYVRKGANVLAIITNDGWWGRTPGYVHHLQYATLRAVETRRSIMRSANTGVSAVINQRGDILQATPAWEEAVIRTSVNTNDTLTFYTVHGDYLGRVSLMLSVLMLILGVVFHYRKANNK